MTKRPERGDNEIVEEIRREVQRTGADPCALLRARLQEAVRRRDRRLKRKIVQAEKFFRLPQPPEEEKVMRYAAHLIMAIRYQDALQERIPLYENVILVYADDDDEAWAKAERLGKREEDESEPLRWDGRPARWSFAGVRKVIECRTPSGSGDRIGPGTEVTYSQLVVNSEEDLRKLVDGEPVQVFYEE